MNNKWIHDWEQIVRLRCTHMHALAMYRNFICTIAIVSPAKFENSWVSKKKVAEVDVIILWYQEG